MCIKCSEHNTMHDSYTYKQESQVQYEQTGSGDGEGGDKLWHKNKWQNNLCNIF